MACASCGAEAREGARFCGRCGHSLAQPASAPPPPGVAGAPDTPTSFADGRCSVERALGEGDKKRVYLAHDRVLNRDVALAVIKTERLDETSRERVRREAQAMARLGDRRGIV